MQPKKAKGIVFSSYRYQLVPLTTAIQQTLFGEKPYNSYDDLISKKNIFFYEVITTERNYQGRGYNVITQIEYANETDIVIRFGVEKTVEINNPDFTKGSIKDYPNIFVYIDNRPDKQLIYIQHNADAFTDADTVAKFMLERLQARLSNYELAIYIERTFDDNEFWETIAKYEGRITFLKFEFIKENLADIAKSAVEHIKTIQNQVNGHKIGLGIGAPKKVH